MTLPSLSGNHWIHVPRCWITSAAAIEACAAAENRERLARLPVQTRVRWWAQLCAVRTVRALFFYFF
jgi:hypothetical protein